MSTQELAEDFELDLTDLDAELEKLDQEAKDEEPVVESEAEPVIEEEKPEPKKRGRKRAAIVEDEPVTEKPTKTSVVDESTLEIDVEQFGKDMQITTSNLSNCLMKQAGLKAYYNSIAAKAEAMASKGKISLELLEAQLSDAYRKKFIDEGVKVTEKMIEAAIKKDKKYNDAANRLVDLKSRAEIAKGCSFAVSERKDMLIQLSANTRQEMADKADMRVLDVAKSKISGSN